MAVQDRPSASKNEIALFIVFLLILCVNKSYCHNLFFPV